MQTLPNSELKKERLSVVRILTKNRLKTPYLLLLRLVGCRPARYLGLIEFSPERDDERQSARH